MNVEVKVHEWKGRSLSVVSRGQLSTFCKCLEWVKADNMPNNATVANDIGWETLIGCCVRKAETT